MYRLWDPWHGSHKDGLAGWRVQAPAVQEEGQHPRDAPLQQGCAVREAVSGSRTGVQAQRWDAELVVDVIKDETVCYTHQTLQTIDLVYI